MERDKHMPEGNTGTEGEPLPGVGGEERRDTALSEEQKAVIEERFGPGVAEELVAGLGGPAIAREKKQTRQGQDIPPGWAAVEIMGPQQYPIEVVWPKKREEAEKHIKDTLALVEISKSDLTQQTQIDLQNAQAILETLEIKRKDPITGEQLSDEQFKDQKDWAHRMRNEIKARLSFHSAFNNYENKGSIKDVSGAALSLAPDWYDVLFELQEEVARGEGEAPQTFNPFIEALQYYEDHGHEFARANAEAGRGGFGKKVQQYLALQRACLELKIDPAEIPVVVGNYEDYLSKQKAKDRSREDKFENLSETQKFSKYQEDAEKEQNKVFREFLKSKGHEDYDELVDSHYKTNEYEWASNMAERMFRFTGRGIMYDYLIINKGKINEKTVGIDYDGPEKPTWAGGRDGCDYPMSKIMRFREFLRAEAGLLRSQIELLEGVDIYGGDFWTRTVRLNAPADFLSYKEYSSFKERTGIDATPDYIDEKGRFLYQDRGPKEQSDEALRINDNNRGERVGHLNFRLLRRKVEKGVVSSNDFSFIPMGAQVMSLWASRFVDGPEEGRKALCGSAESFLLNPNFDTLGKLLNAFEYSKAESWETKKHLLMNFIKYARQKIESTGKQRLSEDEILAGVNKLTGLTDPNAPQFIQMQEKEMVLADYFDIKLSDKEKLKIKQRAAEQAEREIRAGRPELVPGSGDFKVAVDDLTAKKVQRVVDIMVNNKIEHRKDLKFAGSFIWEFITGTLKKALEEGLKG